MTRHQRTKQCANPSRQVALSQDVRCTSQPRLIMESSPIERPTPSSSSSALKLNPQTKLSSSTSKIQRVVRRGVVKPRAENGGGLSRRIRSTPGSVAVTALADRLVSFAVVGDESLSAEALTATRYKLGSLSSDLLCRTPAKATYRRAITLIHRDQAELCRLLIDGQGHVHEALSIALSDIARDSGRTYDTLRQYESAFVWFLEPVVAAYPDFLDRLLIDVPTARATVAAALAFQGFEIKPSRYADGSFQVKVPRGPHVAGRLQNAALDKSIVQNGTSNVKRSSLALLMLKECFESLIMRGRWSTQNPLKVDNHDQFVRLINSAPMPSWANPFSRYAGNMFNLRNNTDHYASQDTMFHKNAILNAAEDFPPGIAFVTRLVADVGARISEPTAVTLFDWVARGAEREIWSSNKGSRGYRTKLLIMSEELAADLPRYIDGDRARFSKVTMKLIRQIASVGPNQLPRYAELLAEPLFLSPKGRQISPHLYRAQYFRPAMKRIGLPEITPHRLRHEHALRSLLAIRRCSLTPEIEAARTAEYATLQGWKSGPRMVHYYAPQFRQMTQRDLADILYADTKRDKPFEAIVEPTANPVITRQRLELRELYGDKK